MLRIHFHPVLLCSPRFGSTFSLSTDTPAHLLLAGMMLDIFAWGIQPWFFYSSKPLLHTSAFPHVEILVCLVGCNRSTEASFSYVNQSIFWSNLVQMQSLRRTHTDKTHTQTHRHTHTHTGLPYYLWAHKRHSFVSYPRQTWAEWCWTIKVMIKLSNQYYPHV